MSLESEFKRKDGANNPGRGVEGEVEFPLEYSVEVRENGVGWNPRFGTRKHKKE